MSQRRANIRRWGCIVIVVIVLIWIGLGIVAALQSCNKSKLPETAFEVRTQTRVYYSDKVEESDGRVILKGYYAYGNGRWEFRNATLVLDEAVYGEITVYR